MQANKKICLQDIININTQAEDVSIRNWRNRKVLQNVCGHNSFFLRKPIIEGKFYVQMIGHQPEKVNEKLKYAPNFRVGLVPTEYYYNYPLGQDLSIAYKTDGSIITNSTKAYQLPPYTFGDYIGVGITIN